MRYDTIIIGAGMSGLAAGVRLAHFGAKTLILERHDRVGGLNSYYTAGGYDLDVGLHAMTNYSPAGPKSAPMARLLRQLRLSFEDLALAPQRTGKIVFPGVTLEFNNEFGRFAQSVRDSFPAQMDNFERLVDVIKEYDDLDLEGKAVSGRAIISSIITDPLLVDMILCPVMFYGSSWEDDMEFGQFVVVFKSMFFEGLARPEGGIRRVLGLLERRYAEAGGEMRLLSGVRRIVVENGGARGVVLDNGERIECSAVLSSAGLPETVGICPEAEPEDAGAPAGRISLMESVNILREPVSEVDASVVFYNNAARFRYRGPDEPVDVVSGVLCFPDNFDYKEPAPVGMVRVTNLADPGFWRGADTAVYYKSKKIWRERSLEAAAWAAPDVRGDVVFSDVFTPRTIERYTGRANGAVYGSPVKLKNGRTPVERLYLIGTDQGFLGIVGAMLSGVTIANILMMSRR